MGSADHCPLLEGGMRSTPFSMWSTGGLNNAYACLQAEGGGHHAE